MSRPIDVFTDDRASARFQHALDGGDAARKGLGIVAKGRHVTPEGATFPRAACRFLPGLGDDQISLLLLYFQRELRKPALGDGTL